MFKYTQRELRDHLGHVPIRVAGDEPWFHCLYRPELILDWFRFKVSGWMKSES